MNHFVTLFLKSKVMLIDKTEKIFFFLNKIKLQFSGKYQCAKIQCLFFFFFCMATMRGSTGKTPITLSYTYSAERFIMRRKLRRSLFSCLVAKK